MIYEILGEVFDANNYVKGSSFQILLVSLHQVSKYCNLSANQKIWTLIRLIG